MSGRARAFVEYGPLMAFFGSYVVARKVMSVEDKDAAIWATGIFMVASVIAIGYSFAIERKVPPMTLVTGAIVLVMGGLTIYLNDETFIQRKPTLVSGLMGGVLLGGLVMGKSLFKTLMGSALQLEEEGWRKLTLRVGLFFLFVAGLNEVLIRLMTFDQWVTVKTFGLPALSFLFLMLQMPMLSRHQIDPEASTPDESA